jgi:5'-phosphate synthase pdxT subunit
MGMMDIKVERNAFGRQVDSFEIDLSIPCLKKVSNNGALFHAIFIRAPLIETVGKGVDVLATLPDGRIVAAQEGHWLATSFHPELTSDDRFTVIFWR